MDRDEKSEDLPSEKVVIKRIAQEILEDKLGIQASLSNIRRLAAHLIVFEREVEHGRSRRRRLSLNFKLEKQNVFFNLLTLREFEIIMLLLEDQSTQTVARRLNLSSRSIKYYMRSARLKFHRRTIS